MFGFGKKKKQKEEEEKKRKAAEAKAKKDKEAKKAADEKAKKQEAAKPAAKAPAKKETKPAAKSAVKPAASKTTTKPAAKPAAKPVVKKEPKTPYASKEDMEDGIAGEISEDSDIAKKNYGRVYHITKRSGDGNWQVKFGGSDKIIKTFSTQAEAIAFTKDLAAKYDRGYIIHKVSGKIRKTTY